VFYLKYTSDVGILPFNICEKHVFVWMPKNQKLNFGY